MQSQKAEFWQSHSLTFLEMAFRTDRQETLHKPDGYGMKARSCGDTVEFYLMVNDDRIRSISYMLRGCINTNACANALIELGQGQTLNQAWRISPTDIAAYLESLPQDHLHCAELAVAAFRRALADARESRRTPWKKLYAPDFRQ